MNFWAPKPKCHYPWTHSGSKEDENRLPSCHSGCFGAVGKQPNPDRQWQQWPLCPTLPCLFLSSLIPFCNVTCAPRFFFPVILSCQIPPRRVICPITVGETFVADVSYEITFMLQKLSAFLSSLRKELSVAAMHHRLSLQNRSLSDSPPSTGRLLETQYCPISARTPQ